MLGRRIKYSEDQINHGEMKQVTGEKAFVFVWHYWLLLLDFHICCLTQLMAREAGMSLDTDGFNAEMDGH